MFRFLTLSVLLISLAAASIARVTAEQSETPFSYPDPRTVGIIPPVIHGKVPVPVTEDRYAGVSEYERQARILQDQCDEIEGFGKAPVPVCPLCENDPKTPCGKCEMCQAGFPCEKTLCRHCIQPLSKNMGNNCDLTAGDEPCGTCDACREHRSDPCEHAEDGYGPLGEFNPYHEPRILAAIPRPILDVYNNGARKFPVYYNPAPYYRPTWNPSIYTGYARPFTFRWFCEHCRKDPCVCDKPGLAGQVSYGYACKFCNRNPCACAQDICDSNKPMDPKGISKALSEMKKDSAAGLPQEVSEQGTPADAQTVLPDGSPRQRAVGGLYDDDTPPDLEKEQQQKKEVKPQPLDMPTPAPPQPATQRTVS
ncbi:MAG: hypothetical protein LBT46_03070 [Planctomycetaceae bacterium]|nr:hypothetical protein [Planctomycetaceae bacterium]